MTEKIINSVLDLPVPETFKRKCRGGNFGKAAGAEFRLERIKA